MRAGDLPGKGQLWSGCPCALSWQVAVQSLLFRAASLCVSRAENTLLLSGGEGMVAELLWCLLGSSTQDRVSFGRRTLPRLVSCVPSQGACVCWRVRLC